MQITKPGTQRKKLFQAPAHLRYKHFSAALSPDLKKKHGANAIPVKVGDTVRLMRGDHKGFEGKIIRVERRKYRIFVEGVTREKVDGTSIPIPIHPSKTMIISLDMSDKWRRKTLNRKGALLEKEGHPPAEAVEEREEIEEKPKPKEVAKKPRRKEKKKREPAKPASKTVKKARKTVKPRRKRTKKAKVEGRSE